MPARARRRPRPEVRLLARFRLFDTAKVYGTEINFKKWFDQDPAVRKQIFLVTKDMPHKPSDFLKMVDQRLAALGTDYIDLFFIHGLATSTGGRRLDQVHQEPGIQAGRPTRSAARARPGSSASRPTTRTVPSSSRRRPREAIVDAIMLQYRPWLDKDSPLNKALDAAWKRGIGLISMKQIASHYFGDKPKGDILKEVVEQVPVLAERKLSPFQGLLHAIWTDERISAVCISMRNTDQIRENADAARRFEPLKDGR